MVLSFPSICSVILIVLNESIGKNGYICLPRLCVRQRCSALFFLTFILYVRASNKKYIYENLSEQHASILLYLKVCASLSEGAGYVFKAYCTVLCETRAQ